MKRNIRIILIILLVIIILIPITYSYAFGELGENFKEELKEKSFLETSKLEYSKNEKVEMTINLDQIKYNKFEFKLESSENMKNLEINANENNKTLNVEKNNNELIIEIDKSTTNLSEITLYYQIPEQMQVNDTIKFIATITNMETQEVVNKEEIKIDDKKDENTLKEDVKIETNDNKDNMPKEDSDVKIETEKETKIIEIKIVEQKEDSNNNNQLDNKPDENIQSNIPNTENLSNMPNVNNESSQKFNMTAYSTSMPSGTAQTVTYNGSDNNYLSQLTVEGYELNKEFSKDNSTYFLTVENSVEALNIDWEKDDSTSRVCIYGDEQLVEGTNKILISVTAENGNVRNYRIYVTKNS